MRHLKVLLVVAAVVVSATPLGASLPDLLRATAPLQWRDEVPNPTQPAPLLNRCTAGFINAERHLWLTAAHCVSTIGDPDAPRMVYPRDYHIAGYQARLIAVDLIHDLAILQTPNATAEVTLQLGDPPAWNDEVSLNGYAWGAPQSLYIHGRIANPFYWVEWFQKDYCLFTAMVIPGMSGSPIVNKKGKIISVLQIGWRETPLSGGATYQELVSFAGAFFGS